jgi:diguanylate cyclase (GGDEF)-like protein/PAS domain S-box-containing protein
MDENAVRVGDDVGRETEDAGFNARVEASEGILVAYARLAAKQCAAPLAFVKLVATWPYCCANGPADAASQAAGSAFCDVAIAGAAAYRVADTRTDRRFAHIVSAPGRDDVLFAAAVPLIDGKGRIVGAICVLDARPREDAGGEPEVLFELGASLSHLVDAREYWPAGDRDQIALLRVALEATADPIAIFRRGEPGVMPTFVYINAAFTDLFGYTSAEVAGKEPKLLSGPQTSPAAREKILAVKGPAPVDYGTLALYTAAGERRYVRMITHGLNPTHRIVSYHDVTVERTAQAALEDENARLQSLIAIDSDAILTFDRLGTCIDANPAAETIVGYPRSELLRFSFATMVPAGMFPGGVPFAGSLTEARPIAFSRSFTHPGGGTVAVDCTTIPIAIGGATDGAYLFAKDVTEELSLSALVAKQRDRASAICAIVALADASNDEQIDAALALGRASFAMDYAYFAEAGETELNLTNGFGERLFPVEGVLRDDAARMRESLRAGEVAAIEDLGESWRGHILAPLHVDGRLCGAVGFLSRLAGNYDAADREFARLVAACVLLAFRRREQDRLLDHLANFDDLTQIHNRAFFSRALASALAEQTPFAVHFLDLDGFKSLNDQAGHAIGDLALQESARRIAELCGEADTVARLGGDEFVVVRPGARNDAATAAFATSLLEALARPFRVDCYTFPLSATMGVALFPEDGEDAATLMQRADTALYRAKALGKNRVEMAAAAAGVRSR